MTRFEEEAVSLTSIELPVYYDETITKFGYSKFRLEKDHNALDTSVLPQSLETKRVNCAIYRHKDNTFLPC